MTSTDMRALGRLGHARAPSRGRRRRRLATRPVRGVPAATARRRLSRPILAAAALLAGAAGYIGLSAAQQSEEAGSLAALSLLPEPATDVVEGRHGDAPARASRSERSGGIAAPAVLADVDGLTLDMPHPEPIVVAFHEASLPEALELVPVGRLAANQNPSKFDSGRDAEEPGYHVLSSRGRPRPATSAVDVVVPQGSSVTAPVTGSVVEARQYALYGSTRDWRVVIEPAERPDLQVVLIHLHRPAVEVGDEVVAGRTPVAVARKLPFTSQVDQLVGKSLPHVHLEVKAATRPKPPDPNAPAVEPEATLDVSS